MTNSMQAEPDASEITVYRKFVAKLMSTKRQLEMYYHGDRYLWEQLMMKIYIPTVQESLQYRVPSGEQQLGNRVANRLSKKTRTAEVTSSYLTNAQQDAYTAASEAGAN